MNLPQLKVNITGYQKSGVSEVIDFHEELTVLRNILQPLVEKSKIEITYSGENGLVRAAIPPVALRQVLISVVSSLILNTSPDLILLKQNSIMKPQRSRSFAILLEFPFHFRTTK